MVKLTTEYLVNTFCKNVSTKSDDSKKTDHIRNRTHLQLHDKCIHEIGDISICRRLTVLYLHNNCLTKIENLQHAVHLTHLYLQKNKISKIDNLNQLKKLRKLYLGQNYISVVEGLETQKLLEELHIEKQHLPMGESLYFDPRTIKELSKCLRVLNVSGNGLHSISDLVALQQLNWFMAKDNQLYDMQGVLQTVGKWPLLQTLEMSGNPIATFHKYRENLIAVSAGLALLDGKNVSHITREFLKRLELNKMERHVHGMDDKILHTIPPDIHALTKNFPSGVRRSISLAIIRGEDPRITRDTISLSTFPSWHKRDYTNSRAPNPLIPRPFWRQRVVGQPQRACMRKLEEIHLPKL